MNVFAVVKENVTARQVAMQYGIKINRSGLACCPFHKDKTPSMKIDKRYYCFGCGDTGDAIDFVAKYFGLAPKEAAMKIASDFGLNYEATNRAPPKKMAPKAVFLCSVRLLSSVKEMENRICTEEHG